MRIGIVKGMIVSTQKAESLVGLKLLIVQILDSNGKPDGSDEVCVDNLGAGVGEKVLLCTGSSAKSIYPSNAPIDLAVVGIIDTIDTDGCD